MGAEVAAGLAPDADPDGTTADGGSPARTAANCAAVASECLGKYLVSGTSISILRTLSWIRWRSSRTRLVTASFA
jgi:hypothetical protein